MDCCNYSEYRGHGQYGASAGWEGYGGYTPLPYAPYAHGYYAPHAHDPYARYFRYDYPGHHVHHNDHVRPMDYGAYGSKEARVRRTLTRRDQRALNPAQHLPLPPTPPLECGMNGRGPAYIEPPVWSHYQMSVMNGGGWNAVNPVNGGFWTSGNACSREQMRYFPDCRSVKGLHQHVQNQVSHHHEGRSTSYPVYENTSLHRESTSRLVNQTDQYHQDPTQLESARGARDRFYTEQRSSPPEEIRPPVVPLPAFQQAFGSTEIGKFAEAFSRAEVVHDNITNDNFLYDSFSEWDGSPELQWSSRPTSREITCEDNY